MKTATAAVVGVAAVAAVGGAVWWRRRRRLLTVVRDTAQVVGGIVPPGVVPIKPAVEPGGVFGPVLDLPPTLKEMFDGQFISSPPSLPWTPSPKVDQDTGRVVLTAPPMVGRDKPPPAESPPFVAPEPPAPVAVTLPEPKLLASLNDNLTAALGRLAFTAVTTGSISPIGVPAPPLVAPTVNVPVTAFPAKAPAVGIVPPKSPVLSSGTGFTPGGKGKAGDLWAGLDEY